MNPVPSLKQPIVPICLMLRFLMAWTSLNSRPGLPKIKAFNFATQFHKDKFVMYSHNHRDYNVNECNHWDCQRLTLADCSSCPFLCWKKFHLDTLFKVAWIPVSGVGLLRGCGKRRTNETRKMAWAPRIWTKMAAVPGGIQIEAPFAFQIF